MPFTPDTKNPGDLIKSQDWNEAMTTIVELLAKFEAAGGHGHTGGTEDGPQIDSAGIADEAITTAKLEAEAVDESKLGDNAVSTGKIADAAVTTAKLANGAISSAKLKSGAVTATKLASGIIPQIGVALTPGLTGARNKNTITPPKGFTAADCVFITTIESMPTLGGIGGTRNFSVTVDQKTGKVTIKGGGSVTGIALARKGGW